jgi:hypothetical protein
MSGISDWKLQPGDGAGQGRFAIIPARVAWCDATGFELKVLAALAAHADRDAIARPSIATLCRLMRIDPKHNGRRVRRALRALERYGLIRCVEPGGGRGRASRYEILRNGGRGEPAFQAGNGGSDTPGFRPEKGARSKPRGGGKIGPKGGP